MISIQAMREPRQHLSTVQLAVLHNLPHEARDAIPIEPWRTHTCLDEIAALLGTALSDRARGLGDAAIPERVPRPAPIHAPEVTVVKGGLAPWQITRVRRHVDAHIEAPLPVESLANLVHLSMGHFCRAFKASLGEPPHGYVTRQRIRHAQRLMLTTNDSLGAISIACGLADQAHLTRLFRKLVGTTPLVWRRANQGG